MRLPKTISLQVGCKLADKTKDEIMTEVLRVSAGLDVKAFQVAYEVVRVTFASPEHFRAAKSFSGKHLFSFWFSILGGAPPPLRACTFSIFLSRRMTDPWRLHSRPMVQSSLTKRRIFFPIKTSLICLVPRRLSFDENVRAKEGGKETTGETSGRSCFQHGGKSNGGRICNF